MSYDGSTYPVTSIESGAFSFSYNLSEINIPETITSIGRAAFGRCTSLTTINIPEGVSIIEPYLFYGCTNLASVIIPKGVTSIGEYIFQDCVNLTSLTVLNPTPVPTSCAFVILIKVPVHLMFQKVQRMCIKVHMNGNCFLKIKQL